MPIIWRGDTALVEQADSPRWKFGDRVTMTRIYEDPFTTCLSNAPMKGALGVGAAAGMRVAESNVERRRGSIGILTIQYETYGQPAQGGTLPPDEVEFLFEQLELGLEEHARYSVLDKEAIRAIDVALSTTDDETWVTAMLEVTSDPRAVELYEKKKLKRTHFVIYPPRRQNHSTLLDAPE